MIVNYNFKLIREVWRFDRVAMAKMFNISRTTWTNYELSITEPPPQVLLQMEKMTGITMRRLLEEELIRSAVRSEPINYEQMADSPPQYVDTVQEKADLSDLENLPVLERVRRIEKVLFGR